MLAVCIYLLFPPFNPGVFVAKLRGHKPLDGFPRKRVQHSPTTWREPTVYALSQYRVKRRTVFEIVRDGLAAVELLIVPTAYAFGAPNLFSFRPVALPCIEDGEWWRNETLVELTATVGFLVCLLEGEFPFDDVLQYARLFLAQRRSFFYRPRRDSKTNSGYLRSFAETLRALLR